MEGAFGQDHWYHRSADNMKKFSGRSSPQVADAYEQAMRCNLAERSLTANDAQSMVDRIKRFLDPANEKHAGEVLTRAYRAARGPGPTDADIEKLVNETLKTLRARNERLPEVLRHLNERNGMPLPPQSGVLPLRLRFAQPRVLAHAPRQERRMAA